jgi:hypothetical protein
MRPTGISQPVIENLGEIMSRFTFRVVVALLTFTIGIALASLWLVPRLNTADKRGEPDRKQTLPLPPLEVAETRPTPSSPIRSIDFSNFIYPRTADLMVPGAGKTFALKDGEFEEAGIEAGREYGAAGMYMGDVVYGDVTGDGAEEAMVSLGVQTAGSAIPNCVYIYTLKNDRLKLLWAFTTGDRADGGLRRIYSEDGGLVLELYGKGTRVGGKLYGTEITGACCALSVTRTHYQWRNNRFRQQGGLEVFPNPAQNSSYVGVS